MYLIFKVTIFSYLQFSPFESVCSHNLQTIFWRPNQISICFVVTYAMKFVFCFTCATRFSLVHPQVFLHLPREQGDCTKAHSSPYCPDSAVESSLHAPITNVAAVFLYPSCLWSHPSCHLSSFYSLNIKMKLLFHLTRSRIACARNLEAGRLFLLSAARGVQKWSSLQKKGPCEIHIHSLCKMVASW